MEKAVIIIAGATRFCVDMKFVEGIHSDSHVVTDILAGLNTGSALVFSLSQLISGSAGSDNDGRQLIVLNNSDITVGLFVDKVGKEFTVDQDALRAMPEAFSRQCRDCFPHVVINDGEVIPMITPESALAMSRRVLSDEM